MTAGRLRYLRPERRGRRRRPSGSRSQGGAQLVLTEAGSKKRAGVWLLTPEAAEAELAHLGPEALGLGADALGRSARRVAAAALAAPRPARDRRDRPRVGERDPPPRTAFAVRALQGPRRASRSSGSPQAIDSELERGLELRERGANDARTYRVHDKLDEPCYVCGAPIARVDYEEHTVYYCPDCQTGGRVLKDRRMSRLLR